MWDLLFSIKYQICKEFPALSPYEIDGKKYGDVMGLFRDLRTSQIRQAKLNDPNRVIRKKAGDNWY